MIEIISDKDRKARKPHICDYCGGTIATGEIYNHCVIKGDDIYTWDAHIVCKSVASDLWDYIDPWEGMTADDFQEGCQKFCRTFICPDCKQWNDGCEQEEPFCIQKIYNLLKTYDFVREKRKYGLFVWKLVAKKVRSDA